VKERIIGAIVLVVFVILVVPVFLDGGSNDTGDRAGDEQTVLTPLTLPGQPTDTATRRTVVLDRDRSEPVPAAELTNSPELTDDAEVAEEIEPEEAEAVAASQSSDADADDRSDASNSVAATDTDLSQNNESSDSAQDAVLAERETPQSGSSAADAAPPPSTDSSSTGMWAVQLGSFSSAENAERLAAGLRSEGFAAFLSRLQSGSNQLNRVRVGPQKDRAAAEAVAAQLAKAGHDGQVVPHP